MAKVEVKCEKCGAINYVDITNHDAMSVPAYNDHTDNVVGRLLTTGCKNEKVTDIHEMKIPEVKLSETNLMSTTNINTNKCSSKGVNVMNKIEALKAAGFTDEQINQMVSVTGVSLDGPAIAKDEIEEKIFKNGYIRNCKLHRRWITAQFINAHFKNRGGVRQYINDLPYMYQFKMMLEEIRVISKLEVSDDECFKERASFFKPTVVSAVCKQYINDLKDFIEEEAKRQHRKCKGVPYVRLRGLWFLDFPKGDVFLADVDKRIIKPLEHELYEVQIAVNAGSNYSILHSRLQRFMRCKTFLEVPYHTPKNKLWIDAYLGAGAYYSLKNLVTYSGLKLRDYEKDNGIFMEVEDNLKYLESLYGWKKGFQLYGLFKMAMKDNNFTLDTFKKICDKQKESKESESYSRFTSIAY